MSLFNFFRSEPKPSAAATAKERLQIVLAHERSSKNGPDYLPMLQKDLLRVIKKYVEITDDKIDIKIDSSGDFSTLELNIELPELEEALAKAKKAS